MIGALPGLSATMAVALLIPVTFGMHPVTGLSMLTAIYTSAIYGGSISAILLHTPGTPASAATAMDGYAMTKQGKGLKALGISTIASMIGGFISACLLLFLAPPLSLISLKFNAPEYFLIAIFGLTIIGSLSSGKMLKGLASGVFGLAIALIGTDILTAYPRYTFGITSLESGISLVPALIGMFSLSQVLIQVEDMHSAKKKVKLTEELKGKVLPSWKEFKSITPTIFKSSFIGTFVGILPGAGGDIGSWVSYNEAKRSSKNPENFGKGSIQGIAASESANNAVTGGALIPLLTLGIPGSAATAILLGGLYIQGLVPGRELFTTYANITYAVIIGFILANILMGCIGLFSAKYIVKVTQVPIGIVAPIIVVLSVVGSYAINNNIFDVYVMVAFGIIGYFMRKTGFNAAPVVLAIILGPMAENGFRQSLIMSKGDMFGYYFGRPISLVIILLIIVSILSPFIIQMIKKRRAMNANKNFHV
nr:tripartite tricarboxylate transporter permease [Anaerobacillus isosaccharinicus]QOY38585.1 tripartite tricarboxylate transporter permease [Anaerobacillus isosaccharinicus]